jgi:hypothetical protein
MTLKERLIFAIFAFGNKMTFKRNTLLMGGGANAESLEEAQEKFKKI